MPAKKMSPELTAARAEFRRLLKRVDRSYDIYLRSLVKTRDAHAHGRFWRQHMTCCNEATAAAPAARVNVHHTNTWAQRRSNHLKTLTPAARERLAPVLKAGLSGQSRQRFVDDGTSLTEQMEEDRLAGRITEYTKVRVERVTADVDTVLPDDGEFLGDADDNLVPDPKRFKRFPASAIATKLGTDAATVRRAGRRLKLPTRDGYTLVEAKQIAGLIRKAK